MTEQPDLPPPTSVESLVAALLEAGPEVAEHVVRAAQELLAAAQVVVDAADKAIREQQDLRWQLGGDDEDAPDEDAPDAAVSPLRRLDVDNAANVAALGELRHGAARAYRHVLLITLGTGVGGAIVANGAVYRGAHGFAAEVGHWQLDPDGARCACGQLGHWEAEASGVALGRMARQWAADANAPSLLARAKGVVAGVDGHAAGDGARAEAPE